MYHKGGKASQFVWFNIAFCITWHHDLDLNIWWQHLQNVLSLFLLRGIKSWGSKNELVHSLPSSSCPHSERRGGWIVLFRKYFEYFYSLLSSIIFLFLEEETPEIFPLFCLIQDCSDSVTSYPEYFSLKKKSFLLSYLPHDPIFFLNGE